MFQSPKTTKNLKSHAQGREAYGQLQHPINFLTWQLVDQMWLEFTSNSRNLRFVIYHMHKRNLWSTSTPNRFLNMTTSEPNVAWIYFKF